MCIDGPSGPTGTGPSAGPTIEEVHEAAPSEPMSEAERSDPTASAGQEPVRELSFDQALEEAASLVPPEFREEFMELVRQLGATDPVLRRMVKRFRRGE